MAHITLKVTGMKCGGCSGRVKRALTALAGVTQTEVTLETGAVVVDFDETQIGVPAIKETVLGLGFKVDA
ncbi:copper chaperone [Opitutaceae bacterium TAV4]|uniref:heavy-metal-associated domain-containing protein n=1 Tax=Geminisphaera colitermitum TaxID=1148786 RepID=UPI0001964FA1|nr:heavy-metal-associated domain-containing protein [Geminisphaera colitermitum]RRJ96656.1 copper chaperone [Opitutaceae bacterium TAV4]RRK00703.1 copper chaperone [Opitutaceae bacterium TAV3]